MKKVLITVLVVFLSLCSVNAYIFAEGESTQVTPSASDYSISGSTITGLKQSYLDTLSVEEKANVFLQLPNDINGVQITSIGADAFSQPKTYQCVGVDFSLMQHLTTIGNKAFYNNTKMVGGLVFPQTLTSIGDSAFYLCSNLTGSLLLPDSVSQIGPSAFRNCSNMKGTLTLPSGLKTICDNTFYNAGFTGQLILPAALETIGASAFRQSNAYMGFTGNLVLPNTLKSVGTVTFSYQIGLNGVQFSTSMTSIPESMFRYCKGLTGAVTIPDSIQSIGRNAFSETGFKTIYLPSMANQENTSFMVGYSFYNTASLVALVCHEKDYTIMQSLLSDSLPVKNKLSYEVDIALKDKSNNVIGNMKKLYNRAYNMVKQSNHTWISDSSYTMPSIQVGNDTFSSWGLTPTTTIGVRNTDLVGTERSLYPIEALKDAVITYSDDLEKVYDTLPSTFKVDVDHPLLVPIKEASEGDVVAYYSWKWDTIGASAPLLQGFDMNSIDIKDVYCPPYAISLRVSVQVCKVVNNKAVPFQTVSHGFSFWIKQAKPTVNPMYTSYVEVKDGLPTISLSENDTEGVITWDENQTLVEGTKEYAWTFTPKDNTVGSSNYEVLKGKASITGWIQKYFDVTLEAGENGKLSTSSSTHVKQGEQLSVSVQANPGYQIQSLTVDGKDVTTQITDDIFVLKDIQSNQTIKATFVKITSDEIKDILEHLPVIEEGQKPTEEQVHQILEAKLDYMAAALGQGVISEATKKQFNELLAELPQVKMQNDTLLKDQSALLENMSIADVQALLDDPNASISLELHSAATQATEVEEQLLAESLDEGMKLSEMFEIDVQKHMVYHGDETLTKIEELLSPVQLSFAIPENLPAVEKGFEREYFIVRIHEIDGKQQVEVLENESKNKDDIVVSSDKFSFYAIAYRDNKLVDDDHDTPGGTPPEEQLPEDNTTKPTTKPSDTTTEKPSTNDTVEVPKTGDTTNSTLWFALGLGALVVMGIFVIIKKKNRK